MAETKTFEWNPGCLCLKCDKHGDMDILKQGRYTGMTFCGLKCMAEYLGKGLR